MQTKTKAALGVGIAGAGAAFLLLVPQAGWWKCPIHATTGFFCPGCGGQRWALAIMQGRFEDAWHYNQLLFFAPLVALIALLMKKLGTSKRTNTISIWALGAIVLAFVIWRNFSPQADFLRA